MDNAFNEQAILINWTEWHSIMVLTGLSMELLFSFTNGLPLVAGVSFLLLIIRSRGFWTTTRTFGLANTVTLLRLSGVMVLMIFNSLNSLVIIPTVSILFLLDGVDGWIARHTRQVSHFGEYFDKETDAFFMLGLCLMLYVQGRVGLWIMIPGILRYGFVLYMKIAVPPRRSESRTATGRWIYVMMMTALILCFTDYPSIYLPITALMTAVLLGSFAKGILGLYSFRK